MRAHSALRNRTKRTRQLHQRGHGLLRNGRGSKLCKTHEIGVVAKDLAGLDDYVSAKDVDSSALRHTHWCQLHQRGVVVGPLFETGEYAHILRNTERNAHVSYINGTLRNGRGSKLGVTHIIGRVAENLAGLDSYGSA